MSQSIGRAPYFRQVILMAFHWIVLSDWNQQPIVSSTHLRPTPTNTTTQNFGSNRSFYVIFMKPPYKHMTMYHSAKPCQGRGGPLGDLGVVERDTGGESLRISPSFTFMVGWVGCWCFGVLQCVLWELSDNIYIYIYTYIYIEVVGTAHTDTHTHTWSFGDMCFCELWSELILQEIPSITFRIKVSEAFTGAIGIATLVVDGTPQAWCFLMSRGFKGETSQGPCDGERGLIQFSKILEAHFKER